MKLKILRNYTQIASVDIDDKLGRNQGKSNNKYAKTNK